MKSLPNDIKLSDIQTSGVKKIVDWFKHGTDEKQIFRVFGWAGAGKSTIVSYALAEMGLSYGAISSEVVPSYDDPDDIPSKPRNGFALAATFTGKASLVLRKKGTPAQTIHSLIYKVFEAPQESIDLQKQEINRLAVALQQASVDQKESLTSELGSAQLRLKEMMRPQFSLNEESILRDASLLVLDECFVPGTMIKTPDGFTAIENLKYGDSIINAIGVDRVVCISKKEVIDAVQIMSGSKAFTCSKNHRFFTSRGEVCASKLRPGDRLVSTAKAMRLLRSDYYPFLSNESISSFLLRKLSISLVAAISGIQEKGWRRQEKILKFWNARSSETNREDQKIKPRFFAGSQGQNKCGTQTFWLETSNSWRQWARVNRAAKKIEKYLRQGMDNGIRCFNKISSFGLSECLQTGYCSSSREDRHRTGWWFPLFNKSAKIRQEKTGIPDFFRVDSVEVLEQRDSRLDKFRDESGKLYLWDIQAEKHKSFSVEEVLVHNCSMVSEDLARDLLSFEKPILVLGDPGQLPPIRGEGFFINAEPDVFLSEIHRQALDNPIIRLSMMAREGQYIGFGEYSDNVMKLPRNALSAKDMLMADQCLCGYNATRIQLNNAMKKAAGFTEWFPTGKGEKIICLRNMNDIGLINGGFLKLENCGSVIEGRGGVPVMMAEITTDEGDYVGEKQIYLGHFQDHVNLDKERDAKDRFHKKGMVECVWGNAITVHKSQGSGWGTICLFDDGFGRSSDDRKRWLYTAITRAENGLVILA